jgi:hypothetical protein
VTNAAASGKRRAWFCRKGWFYLPKAAPGWIITGVALAFCVQTFIAVDARSHSVSDTLYGVFPYWAPTFLLLQWIGRRGAGD